MSLCHVQLEGAGSISLDWVMSAMKVMSLRLNRDDYERLESEADRLGIPPATLVRMFVRAGLNEEEPEAEKRRRIGLEALDRLAELTADLPPVDAVKIIREGREELEGRASF